jgi:hypothetical protein
MVATVPGIVTIKPFVRLTLKVLGGVQILRPESSEEVEHHRVTNRSATAFDIRVRRLVKACRLSALELGLENHRQRRTRRRRDTVGPESFLSSG